MSVPIPRFMKKMQIVWTSTPANFRYEPPLRVIDNCGKDRAPSHFLPFIVTFINTRCPAYVKYCRRQRV